MCQSVSSEAGAGGASEAVSNTVASAVSNTVASAVCDAVKSAVSDAVRLLTGADIPREQLASLTPERRRLFVRVAPKFTEITPVWRVGCLLLAEDGRVWATAKTTRAAKRERLGIQSVDQELRRDLAGFAFKSGFAQGTQVNYDAPLLFDPAQQPALQVPSGEPSRLVIVDGTVRVLWSPSAAAATAPQLKDYLRERIELITEFK